MDRRTTVVGKFVFMFVSKNFGFKSPNHIYFADLEKNGEIRGKIPLTPIHNTDFSSAFDVSETTNKTSKALPVGIQIQFTFSFFSF